MPGSAAFLWKKKRAVIILGSKTKDCREIATLLREKTGARGGGSAAMIQGSVSAEEKDLRELLA